MITDSTGQVWSKDEVQFLILQIRSLTKVARRLGLKNTKQLRDLSLLTPSEYVLNRAKLNPNWLKDLIIRLDSKKKTARYLNISITTLLNILKEIECQYKTPEPTLDRTREVLKKFGSVELAARILEITTSDVKRILGEEWRVLKDGTKAGDTSVRTGQIAERYILKLREAHILEDTVLRNHNNPGYDYIDAEWGKVNVKGAPRNSSGSYTWEFHPKDNLETLALVFMSAEKEPIGSFFVKKEAVILRVIPKVIYITERSGGKLLLRVSEKNRQQIIDSRLEDGFNFNTL